jgi:hypothetical protein
MQTIVTVSTSIYLSLSLGFAVGTYALEFSEGPVNLSVRAAELSQAAYYDNITIAGMTRYEDEPDVALTVQEGDVCFGVFRGTTTSLADWMQNINLLTSEVCPSNVTRLGGCCLARAGFVEAYFQTSYFLDFEADMRLCKEQCPGCEVVLTGHSQGGAIAAIAAVSLNDLNPMVITIGEPASIVGECDSIDQSRYFRFINTIVVEIDGIDGLGYDIIPFLYPPGTDQVGQVLLLGDDDKNVVYYLDQEWLDIQVAELNVTAHMTSGYVDHLKALQASGSFPIGGNGWAKGFVCNQPSECIIECVNHVCTGTSSASGGRQRFGWFHLIFAIVVLSVLFGT